METMEFKDLLVRSVISELPPRVNYIPNFITCEEERDIIQKINSAPMPKWTQLSHRRLQNWGGVPHSKGMIAEEIPRWLQTQVNKVDSLGVFEKDKTPNHVLINEYLPGQGIMAHSDGPLFHPIVTTISCGSHTLLDFYKRFDTDNIVTPKCEFSLLLEPRSLLILQQELYHDHLHSIAERTSDILSLSDLRNVHLCSQVYNNGQTLKRSTRLSLTIRHVPKTSKLKLKLGR